VVTTSGKAHFEYFADVPYAEGRRRRIAPREHPALGIIPVHCRAESKDMI
jgi:hypothetical protein